MRLNRSSALLLTSLVAVTLVVSVIGNGMLPRSYAAGPRRKVRTHTPTLILTAIGDSLTHGTMDATNNFLNTRNAYLEKVAESLDEVVDLRFRQPYFNLAQDRINPLVVPTNLAVDGAQIFSASGIEYYKRVGAPSSYVTKKYLSDKVLPREFADKTDRVIYPINILPGAELSPYGGLSQLGGARWWLQRSPYVKEGDTVATVVWLGNNDSSLAALGQGGDNPMFYPIPVKQMKPKLHPKLSLLLEIVERLKLVSFAPYTPAAAQRNLTDVEDFEAQFQLTLDGLQDAASRSRANSEIFVVTLPYYSSVGYLMDSEDIEFYLRKLDPEYEVPPTFARVTPDGEPITNPLQGDRVSLLTFGIMYALLSTGSTAADVNEILEVDGVQQDGLVLSEAEQLFIVQRINEFNNVIANVVDESGPGVHLVDVGGILNAALTGEMEMVIGGKTFNRHWSRGNGFSLDGVHPGYTAQALISNIVLTHMNEVIDLNAPMHALEQIVPQDPYVDFDGDGWVPGPQYRATGITSLLFLLTDPNDHDPQVQVSMNEGVWELVSEALLEELFGSSAAIAAEARKIGAVPRRP